MRLIASFLFVPLILLSQISGGGSSSGLPGPAGPAGPIGPPGPAGADGAPGVPGYSPNSLVSGGIPVWVSGLTFSVPPATYYIGGTKYISPQSSVTLGAADSTFTRIDIIAVNSSGAVVVIPGTASSPPVLKPSVNPATQLYLTDVTVPANATTPSNVIITDIYHENTEWTAAGSTHINVASTVNPHAGSLDVEATSPVTGNYARFTGPGNIDPATVNNVIFWIAPKSNWPAGRSLQIQWYTTNTAKGSIVVLNNGAFGFNTSSTTYQQIVIPVTLFQAGGLSVNRIQFTIAGSGTFPGFYLDDITLQSGLPPAGASNSLVFKGVWNTTATYSINDLVTYTGFSWAALASNTNSAPTTANTNWSLIANAGSPCAAAGASTTDYACSLTPSPVALLTGGSYVFKADVANTAASGKPTISFNSLAAKKITKVVGGVTTELAANDIQAGQWVSLIYDGTNMQMQSVLGNPSMTYPGAGVANSTGSAWGTSYTVGTAANNLVQLNGSIQLPAVSGALLTNLPVSGLVLVEQHTASNSATLDFTTCFSSTYDEYELHIINLIPANTGSNLQMLMGTGTIDTGNSYGDIIYYDGLTDSLTGTGNALTGSMRLVNSVSSSASYSANVRTIIYNPGGSNFKQIHSVGTTAAGANLYRWSSAGVWRSTSAADRFRLQFATGNITSGTARCYGISK